MTEQLEKPELIATEVWKRITAASGVKTTQRNPEVPPEAEDMPAILLFELDDIPEDPTMRNGYPAFKRVFNLAIEIFVKGSSAAAASRECRGFLRIVRKALYAQPYDLGGLGRLEEKGNTPIVSYDAANHIKAIGIGFKVRYGEQTADLFTE